MHHHLKGGFGFAFSKEEVKKGAISSLLVAIIYCFYPGNFLELKPFLWFNSVSLDVNLVGFLLAVTCPLGNVQGGQKEDNNESRRLYIYILLFFKEST